MKAGKGLIIFLILIASFSFGGEIEKHILPNGMVVIIKERDDAPVVNIQAWVRCGSINEEEYLGSGISHFIEHMLFKGTEKRGVGKIPEEIAMYGGEIRGYTSKDRTVYSINIPKDYFENGLEIMADALMNPSFDPQELEKEREVILKEINMNEDDPERVIDQIFWQTAFHHHPCRHPTIGYREILNKLTREDLIHFYKRMYTPEAIILCVVGAIKKEKVIEEIERNFRDFIRRPTPRQCIPDEPRQISTRRVTRGFDVNLAYLRMGFHIPNITGKDVYALDVLAYILGDGRLSRFYRKIKEEKGLVHSISAWSYTPKYKGVFGIDATLDHSRILEVEKAILDEIALIQKKSIGNKELSSAKKRIVARWRFARETVEGEAKELAANEFFTGDPLFSKTYIERILRVTRDDVRNVANRYLRRSNLTIVSLVPKTEKEIQGHITHPTPESIPIKRVKLENGLVILAREDRTHPLVSIRAIFKGGARVEDERTRGISNLVSRMLLKGTKRRSEYEIAREIEGRGGRISSYAGNNSIGISIDLLKEDLRIGLEVLADIIMNPSFDGIEREKELIMAEIRSVKDDPFEATLQLMRKTLFKVHPLRSIPIGEIETIKRISKDELLRFYRTHYTPGNMVLSIFGDVDQEEAIKMAIEVFSGFKRNGPQEIPPIDEPKIDGIRRSFLEIERKQTIIMIGFHGIDVRSDDRYAFEVLTAIISGHDGRLFKRLREERPLSYMVGSFPIFGLDNGAYIFYISTIPRYQEEATEGLLKEIERLREEEVLDDELLRAKRQLIGKRQQELQVNSSFSLIASLDELYGLGYQNHKEYKDRIEAVSKEDIKRIAKIYFPLDAYAIVFTKPGIQVEE